MHKGLLLFLWILIDVFFVNGQSISKLRLLSETKCSAAITSISISDGKVLAGTESGCIDIFTIDNLKRKSKIILPLITDFMGDSIKPGVYSMDEMGATVLIVSQGKSGYSNVFIFSENKISQIIDSEKEKLPIKKASFVDDGKILLTTVGNELILMDINNLSVIYKKQISPYTFSNYVLSVDKSLVFTSDESGVVHQINVSDGNLQKEFEGMNVDNVYQLDYKTGIILTGGKDRRTGVYNTFFNDAFYLQHDFMVLCVALSPDGKYAAFMSSEKGEFSIFDTTTKEVLIIEEGRNSPLSDLVFVDDNTLLSADEKGKLYLWKMQ